MDKYTSRFQTYDETDLLMLTVCSMIASKYEEDIIGEHKTILEYMKVTNGGFKKREVILYEIHMLNIIEYQLRIPLLTNVSDFYFPLFNISQHLAKRHRVLFDIVQKYSEVLCSFKKSTIVISSILMGMGKHKSGFDYNDYEILDQNKLSVETCMSMLNQIMRIEDFKFIQ